MTRTHLLLVASLALTTSAFAADRTFDRTLSVSNSPTVTAQSNSGNIHIHPGDDNSIHIAGRVKSNNGGWFSGNSSSDADRVNRIAQNPPIQQSGNTITIGERGHDDLYRNLSIEYDITLPRGSALTAETGSGDIQISDAGQSLRAETGSGNIVARGIHGPATLHTGSGNIELRQTAEGEVRAGTGSGNITLEGTPTTNWRVQTGSGNIHLDLGHAARFTLDADTGSGSIGVQQPITMQGSLDKHHIHGAVNGGGPTIKATTGSGDIEIR